MLFILYKNYYLPTTDAPSAIIILNIKNLFSKCNQCISLKSCENSSNNKFQVKQVSF